MSDTDIMVSICCITYNHQEYIGEALEGFVMQKTNFKFEIIIGEDCSTDKTRDIIKAYAEKYSNVKLITSEANVGPNKNAKRVLEAVTGKYIALCDGDDYWTNELKLQKQVDFLEQNPNYVICCHYCKEVDQAGHALYVSNNPVGLHYSYNELMINKQAETSTASMVIRSNDLRELFTKDWYSGCNAVDKFIKLFATSKSGKKVYVIPEVMSCYRRHQGGIWSMTDAEVLKQRQLSDFNLIIQHFEHTFFQKVSLLVFYIRRYFLFEVRKSKISNALQTIRSIYN